MFDPMEDQGEAKDVSIGYIPWCQFINALQEGHAEVNSAGVSTTTTIYPLSHYEQRLKNQNQNVNDYTVHLSTADQW